MMIDTQDKRTVKALVLCADAGQWLKARRRDGQKAYGVPSQSKPGLYHLTTCSSCTCPDARRGNLCYHQRAVALHVALVKAVQPTPKPTADIFDRFKGD